MKPTNSAIPPAVVEAFATAAMTVLQELVQMEGYVESPVDPEDAFPSSSVAAVIRLLRPIPGKMTLVVDSQVAAQLAARYLPADAPLTEELVDDVVGEFANVIAGQAKTILKGTPHHFTMTTPVVSRPMLSPESWGSRPAVALVFELGRLLVFVEMPASPVEGASPSDGRQLATG